MIYELRQSGLGALPSYPSNKLTPQGGLLKPNHEWIRYYQVDYYHQLKQCPKNAPYGCWMVNGYAWGQREWYPDEFPPYPGWTPPPAPKPFPAPKTATTATAPAPTPTTTKPKTTTTAPKPAVGLPSQPSFPVSQPDIPLEPTVEQLPPSDTIETYDPNATSKRWLVGVGAVVGIGLFVALALTAARKKR